MRTILFFLFSLLSISLFSEVQIYQNYIVIYGEGPVGQYALDFQSKTYSEQDAVRYAKQEIIEYLSGMVYGYRFTYKLENKVNGRKGYFDLEPIAVLKGDDPGLQLRQYSESPMMIKIQAMYRLTEQQKAYMQAFASSSARMSQGGASDSWVADWSKRLEVYQDALKNAVFNAARKKYKSRPQYVKGRILLKETPRFFVEEGQWKAVLKIHLIFDDVSYQDSY